MNRTRWAPVGAVGGVLAVLIAVAVVSSEGRAAGPPVLRIATADSSYGAAVDGSYPAAADGSYPAVAGGARGSYRLIGKLPEEPSEARLRDLPATAVPVARVRALAVALGETAAPMRVAGVWRAGKLVVTDPPGNSWTWGPTCGPETPVSSDGGVTKDIPVLNCPDASGSSGSAAGGASSGSAAGGASSGSAAGGPSSGTGSIAGGSLTCIVRVGGTGCSVPDSVGTPGSAPSPSSAAGGASSGSVIDGAVSCMRDGPCAKPTVSACPSPSPGAKPVACNVSGIPLPLPRPPERVLLTESQALTATAKIRRALGLGDAPTRVEGLSVVVEPLAGGLPTIGMATRLQLSSQGRLINAAGSLSIGQEGAVYPLRTARKAFDVIPALALGAPCDVTGCPEGPAVTGARLGLSRVALDHGAAALVPAWLFTVQGSPLPLVTLAVADRYLAGPSPVRSKPGTGPGITEPGDTAPNTAGPGIAAPGTAAPGTIEPNPNGSLAPPPPAIGKPAGPQGREGFAFDAAYADADPNVLVVRYGDSGSCPSQAVRHDVVEQPNRVVVTLTRTPMPADQPCRMDYQAKLVRITLSAPLGSREVVDGSRKVPVPISTGLPPLG